MIVLDTETTGTNPSCDQIIEICLSVNGVAKVWRARPTIAIPAASTAVHHITDADVADCPPFAAVAAEIAALVSTEEVVAGFNLRFDLDMLQSEMVRAGLPPINLSAKHLVCALRLWHHVEPRTLVAAHQKFCGEPMANAHQASADVAATARVLGAMIETFGMTGRPWSEIAAVSDPFSGREAWLGSSSHIQWDESGAVVFGFGKYKGQQVANADGGFLRWVLAKDFPPHVKKICTVALERRRTFAEWIDTYYPRPAAKTPVDLDLTADESDAEAPAQGVLL